MPDEGEKPEESFQIKDKRRFNTDGSPKNEGAHVEEASPETAPRKPSPEKPSPPQDFEINFSTFILSLASSVQISLGLIPHPMTNKAEVNLVSAKQTIDILGIMEAKTKGNLSAEEDRLLKQILFELRMQYVEIAENKKEKK